LFLQSPGSWYFLLLINCAYVEPAKKNYLYFSRIEISLFIKISTAESQFTLSLYSVFLRSILYYTRGSSRSSKRPLTLKSYAKKKLCVFYRFPPHMFFFTNTRHLFFSRRSVYKSYRSLLRIRSFFFFFFFFASPANSFFPKAILFQNCNELLKHSKWRTTNTYKELANEQTK
jgi:hypothetical protein